MGVIRWDSPIRLYTEGFPADQVDKAIATWGVEMFEIVTDFKSADITADLDSSKVPTRGCSVVSQTISNNVITKAVIHTAVDRPDGCYRGGKDALAIALAHELGHSLGVFEDVAHP